MATATETSTLLFCRMNESMKKEFASGTRRHASALALMMKSLMESFCAFRPAFVACFSSSPFSFVRTLNARN